MRTAIAISMVAALVVAFSGSSASAQTRTDCSTDYLKKQVSRAVAANYKAKDPYRRGTVVTSWPVIGSTLNITRDHSNHTAGKKTRGQNTVNLVRSGFKGFKIDLFKGKESAGDFHVCVYTYPASLAKLGAVGQYRRLKLERSEKRSMSARSRKRTVVIDNLSKKRLVTIVFFSPRSNVRKVYASMRASVLESASKPPERTKTQTLAYNAEVESTAKFFLRRHANSGYCFWGMGKACRPYGAGKQQTGTPIDVVFELKGHSKPWRAVPRDGNGTTHCTGTTISIISTLLKKHGMTRSWSRAQALKFYGDWVGYADRSKTVRRKRAVAALVSAGLGDEITDWNSVRPGDFVELNRNGYGHSVVFQEWLRDAKGNKVGIYYLSSQDPTNGIGYAGECFEGKSHRRCGRTKIAKPKSNVFFGRFTGGK